MTAASSAEELWTEVGIDPVKIALPANVVGYTLRAYRPASQVTPTDAPTTLAEDDPFAAREQARRDEDAANAAALLGTVESPAGGAEPAPPDSDEPAELTDEEELGEEDPDEEVPLFLSHQGRLLLFGTPGSLAEFIRGDEPHDLRQLDTWPTVAKRVRPEDVDPADQDTYELDLVVENLRGGHDAWDLTLLVSAGEIARDLGHALRLTPVISAMAAGSPLDDLDETVRAAAAGGIGGVFARRRLRRIGAQQASLGWRTVIGKISDAVDWRD